MNISPGDHVDVQWDRDKLFDMKGKIWINTKVVDVWKYIDGETLVLLEGHPYCPVRIERIQKTQAN